MKKPDIKMIGFDLDGTLLTSEKELTEYTRSILMKAIEQGIEVLPATGRTLGGLPEEILTFPGIRYALTANGARIIDMKEGKLLYENLVSYETAGQLLDIFLKYDALVEIYYDGIGYAQKDMMGRIAEFFPNKAMANYVLTTRRQVVDVREKYQKMKQPSDKVQAVFKTVKEKDAVTREVIAAVKGIEVASALGNNIEVTARGVNKGEGMLHLGNMLGIRAEEMMTFGDGENDIPMIECAGFGVAMANSIAEVKAAAKYITVSNDEDGVAKTIEKYLLNAEESKRRESLC